MLAALVVSKVYYHLGEYDESMMFALGAGKLFDISSKDEYVETIICTAPSSPVVLEECGLLTSGNSKIYRRIHLHNFEE